MCSFICLNSHNHISTLSKSSSSESPVVSLYIISPAFFFRSSSFSLSFFSSSYVSGYSSYLPKSSEAVSLLKICEILISSTLGPVVLPNPLLPILFVFVYNSVDCFSSSSNAPSSLYSA